MKVKRGLLLLLCLGLILSMMLTGCVKVDPLPDSMDEMTVLAAGEEVVQLLLDGEYGTVVGMLREDIRSQGDTEIKAEHIEELMNQFVSPEDVGTFKKFGKKITEGRAEPETLGIANIQCVYSEKDVVISISYDTEMNLIGVGIARD